VQQSDLLRPSSPVERSSPPSPPASAVPKPKVLPVVARPPTPAAARRLPVTPAPAGASSAAGEERPFEWTSATHLGEIVLDGSSSPVHLKGQNLHQSNILRHHPVLTTATPLRVLNLAV